MQYKVIEWAEQSPHTISCFLSVEPTAEMKQAIVNDIRENGYFFDMMFCLTPMYPVLNTGEAVRLERELCEELTREAYGLSEEEYAAYYDRASKNPHVDFPRTSHFVCDYPMKRIVWVNDDAFDDLKNAIEKGDCNADVIPDDYIHLKKGDVVRYTSEDESKYFEVQVEEFFEGARPLKISDIAKLPNPTAQDLLSLFQGNEPSGEKKISYRYEGRSGEKMYEEFERIYGTYLLSSFSFQGFDVGINMIVFRKTCTFTRTVLEKPSETPIREEALKSIREEYEESVREENRKKEEFEQRMLRLKEKMAKRKQENKE